MSKINLFGERISPSNITDSLARITEILELKWTMSAGEPRERGFVTTHTASVASGGGTINLNLRNPAGSGRTVRVERFIVTSQFRGEFIVHDEFTSAPSGGTANGLDNLLMDTEGIVTTGVAVDRIGVSFTGDGPHLTVATPGGGEGGNSVGGSVEGTEPLIEPGREIVLELQNDSSTARKGTVGVVFTELDGVFSEQAHPP